LDDLSIADERVYDRSGCIETICPFVALHYIGIDFFNPNFNNIFQSVVYPAAQSLWSTWAPPNERSRLIGFSYAG
jgi:hypothetical protein